MALSDIIQAIKTQADREIAVIQEASLREKNAIQKKNDEDIATAEKEAKKQTAEKKEQLMKKAETMVKMERKKMMLQEKRLALDTVYKNVLQELQQLPSEKKKELVERLMKHVHGRKGEVKEIKEGGFLFVSDNAEENYSFPHLIQHTLRPRTEIAVSTKLFT
jgi:vacuolar-type H+-ATPase subunit E/Vma4